MSSLGGFVSGYSYSTWDLLLRGGESGIMMDVTS